MKYQSEVSASGLNTSLFSDDNEKLSSLAVPKGGSRKHEAGIKRSARLQVILPEASVERLEKLKDNTEAASYSEVIRIALRLYEGLIEEIRNGSKISIDRPDGSKENVLFYS